MKVLMHFVVLYCQQMKNVWPILATAILACVWKQMQIKILGILLRRCTICIKDVSSSICIVPSDFCTYIYFLTCCRLLHSTNLALNVSFWTMRHHEPYWNEVLLEAGTQKMGLLSGLSQSCLCLDHTWMLCFIWCSLTFSILLLYKCSPEG